MTPSSIVACSESCSRCKGQSVSPCKLMTCQTVAAGSTSAMDCALRSCVLQW